MVDFFCLVYGFFCRSRELRFFNYANKFIRLFIRFLANIFVRFVFCFLPKKLELNEAREKPLVVSLTSFPPRIHTVWLTVGSLLMQDAKPDVIVIWLSRDQFKSVEELPYSLRKLERFGLQIRLVDGDIKSHKKYYYAFKEFGDSDIILCDDDILYPSYAISDILSQSKKHPGKVVARYAKKMVWDNSGGVSCYGEWPKINDGLLRKDIFFGSGGGVYIPKQAISLEVFNKDTFLSVCPYADDVWLNAMCRLVSLEMVSVDRPFIILPVISFNSFELSKINNDQGMNDIQIDSTRDYCINSVGLDPFLIVR